MESKKQIERKIRASLERQGTYTKDLDMCISIVASSYFAMQIAQRDMEGLQNCYVEEIDRYGNNKLVLHPSFKALKDAQESVRKGLRELNLTLSTLTVNINDDFSEMNREQDDIEKGDD